MTGAIIASGAHYALDWARRKPQALAVAEGAARHSYGELAAHVAGAARALEAAGVQAGLIIGLECESPYLRLLLALACETLGAVHVHLNAAELTLENETARRCRMFAAEQADEALAALAPVVRIDRAFAANVFKPAAPQDLARLAAVHDPDAGVRIARTSGATGAPKHVLKTGRKFRAALDAYERVMPSVAGDLTYLCCYSPAINGVYTDIVRALRFGNRIRFISGVPEFIAAAQAERSYAFLLPREAEQIAAACRQDGVDLDMLYVDVTGSGLSAELAAALRASVSRLVANVYSSNETSLVACRDGEPGYGLVPGVEVRIVDEAWRPRPPGEPGRICVRSPLVADGYLWDRELTARRYRDGWFLMSDLGFMPAPGRLVVLGRADDMLDVGGVKIAPYPVEQALRSVPGVDDAVLLTVRSAAAVGALCAAVEPAPGQDETALAHRVAEVVGRHARSFLVHVEPAFPRTATGKVRREALRARVEASRRETGVLRP